MNKKGQIKVFSGIIIAILLIGLFFYGIIWLSKIGNDTMQKANCNIMAKNGYNTHIETIWMLGVPFKDCYIQTKTGGSVPYDRFRALG